MKRDLRFLARRHDPNPAAGFRGMDGIQRGLIAPRVYSHALPLQPGTDRGAHHRVVLADAARENQQIDTVESGDHCSYLLARRIAEDLNREARLRPLARLLVETPHVPIDT